MAKRNAWEYKRHLSQMKRAAKKKRVTEEKIKQDKPMEFLFDIFDVQVT